MNAQTPASRRIHPQTIASDPAVSAFVAANAGSGKTKTLVERVARLLLRGAPPETILCVTYTKAAAAEMQRRLYHKLGGWSVLDDEALGQELSALGEQAGDLQTARRLFARALETPGGLKIQTIHAFCEKLLRRFPLEAGVSPDFRVMEEAEAREVCSRARDALARQAAARPDSVIASAYNHFAGSLDLNAFESLLAAFERDRSAVAGFIERSGGMEGAAAQIWSACGFTEYRPTPEEIEAEAAAACEMDRWAEAAEALLQSPRATDQELGAALAQAETAAVRVFEDVWRPFRTDKGTPRVRLGSSASGQTLEFLKAERDRLHAACLQARAARCARQTQWALALCEAYGLLYDHEKSLRGALDFSDLIEGARRLLTRREDAVWVLFKLDGRLGHILLDEAQDTSAAQWEILEALSAEFFSGEGRAAAERTVFAVGDEKQSIFSFQGADPQQLQRRTVMFGERAAEADLPFARVPLLESWRSAPEILHFVDLVFAEEDTRRAVPPPPGSDHVAHQSVRPAGYGSVELWDLFKERAADAADAWDAPQDAPAADNARRRLAQAVAAKVKAMIAGEAVVAKGRPGEPTLRPVAPGDVLILVRRRDALFDEIIRALKRADVPVAGADRLKLSAHVVFQDILSLCRFCLFPDDDLSLAETLRSPFCELDEQAVFDLAHGRSGALWARLRGRLEDDDACGRAARFLAACRTESRQRPAFDFLTRTLARPDEQGRSYRQRLLTRLGGEAEDALEEVLHQALAAEARGLRDLEQLTAALERSTIEVKRELSAEDGGFVRVMTVHGSKGLEAPIVILPDTTGRPPPSAATLLRTPQKGFLFAPRRAEDFPASEQARALADTRAADEQLRLLYVALTRARDRLIIAGRLTARETAPSPTSWYARLAAAFDRASGTLAARTAEAEGTALRRIGADPPTCDPRTDLPSPPPPPPPWLRRRAPAEAVVAAAAPSGSTRSLPVSPLASASGLGRYRRGELIHRLLQLLPDLPVSDRARAARRLLDKEADLTADQREDMAEAALGVLHDPVFAKVFGPGSRAEATLAGAAPYGPPGVFLTGRVDRLIVAEDRVLVVDFKTNRPAPARIEEADPAYVLQLAVYAALLREVFPNQPVEAALIWTDGPKLMPVPDKMMGEALAAARSGR